MLTMKQMITLYLVLGISRNMHVGLNELSYKCPQNCHCAEVGHWKCQEMQFDTSDEISALGEIQLKSLIITKQTNFQRLWPYIINASSLEVLDIKENQLIELPRGCFKRTNRLYHLDASNNIVTRLDDGAFEGLFSLKNLILKKNKIAYIGLNVFSNVTLFGSIELIDLSDNKLLSIDSWPILLGLYGKQKQITFANNYIAEFTNHLSVTINSTQNLFVNIECGENDVHHISDVFTGWTTTSSSLFHQIIQFMKVTTIKSNPIQCDCIDYVFLVSMIEGYIGEFMWFCSCEPGISIPQTRPSDLTCDVTSECPTNCKCLQRPYNNTLLVDCSRASLTSIPTKLPSRKPMTYLYTIPLRYELILSHNSIASIEDNPIFNHTVSIDISNGKVSSVSLTVLKRLKRAKRIFLHKNKLSTLPVGITSINFTVQEWTLHDNPWSCSCDNEWLQKWFKTLPIRNEFKIVCSSPSWHSDKDLMQVDFCYQPPADYKRLLEICLSLLFAIIFIVIIFTYSWKKWKYFIYEKSGIRYFFDRDECTDEGKSHDIFLSCSQNDIIKAKLFLDKLENVYGFRVTFHSRDFQIGVLIWHNVFKAIQNSKRTLCLVSKHFLSSYWCLEEFKAAYLNDMELRKHRLLIVLLEEVDLNQSSLPVEVENYFQTRTYIETFKLSEDELWRNLLYCLPTPNPHRCSGGALELVGNFDSPLITG